MDRDLLEKSNDAIHLPVQTGMNRPIRLTMRTDRSPLVGLNCCSPKESRQPLGREPREPVTQILGLALVSVARAHQVRNDTGEHRRKYGQRNGNYQWWSMKMQFDCPLERTGIYKHT